jgi:very-short-patch-repair endonuclease
MTAKNPSPASRSLGTLSHKGRGLRKNTALLQPSPTRGEGDNLVASSTLPSPLVGEGGNARSALTGEGAAGRTLRLAKRLRKNMTDAETRLWHELRANRFEDYKFKRQVPIGKYIADFACLTHKLIIEVDGSQHENSEGDMIRDQWLVSQGFRVLRLWNRELLLDTDGALLSILAALKESPLPALRATLSHKGRGQSTSSKLP